MPSIHDVASLAAVSTATVSRVLSGSTHPVADQTRRRVLDAARVLDFEPNLLASGLASRRTQVVAVMVHDMMDEYFSEIARGIEDEAYANGYATLVCNADRDGAKELLYLRKLRALHVDAILLTAGAVLDPVHQIEMGRQLDRIRESGGVIVRLAPHGDGRPDIGYSNAHGFALAVEHLVRLGHTRIAFLAGPGGIATSVERLAAMRRAMRRHGLPLPASMVFEAGFSRTGGELASAAFLAGDRIPATAVVAANDQAAIGFVRGLRTRSIDVPGDVSVVGFDDIAPCRYVEPPLTTVRVPLHELGVRGMRRALDLLRGATPDPPVELPLELAIRSSTAPAAAPAPASAAPASAENRPTNRQGA